MGGGRKGEKKLGEEGRKEERYCKYVIELQGDQLNMDVFFLYLVISDLFSVCLYMCTSHI